MITALFNGALIICAPVFTLIVVLGVLEAVK